MGLKVCFEVWRDVFGRYPEEMEDGSESEVLEAGWEGHCFKGHLDE